MGFEVLHGIVDCLWVVGEPISKFKEAGDGNGTYNRYFGRLNTGKMKIQGVTARKGDTPEYVNKMQQELFEVLAQARSLEEL